jgi:uncharacterized membrane protein YeaQ/YmgE (transglycosylase-associated protein family)
MLWMILVGLFVGLVAKLLRPGRDPGGIVMTIVIGILGSVIAGVLGRSIGWYSVGAPAGFIASIAGAILLLFLYRVLTGQDCTALRDARAHSYNYGQYTKGR